MERFIGSAAAREHHGLWASNATPRYDITALAYVLHPEDPRYLREFLAAKAGQVAPFHWPHGAFVHEKDGHVRLRPFDRPHRPYLAREKDALERLALLTDLTPAESTRLEALAHDPLAATSPVDVSLRDMLAEYRSNEVRADDTYKDKVVEFSGIVGDIQRSAIGGINIDIGTGAEFEQPTAVCFVDDSFKPGVVKLSKGDRVEMRGQVQGLMTEVVLEHCRPVP